MPSLFLLAFWLLVLGAVVISWQVGDQRDRPIVATVLAASLVSGAIYLFLDPMMALVAVTVVDTALLFVVYRYAMTSQRHWPLWFAGFLGAAVLFELMTFVTPRQYWMIPWRLAGFWTLPSLFAMTIGLLADKRGKVQQDDA
ncbi:hypothetical protein E3U23_06925 [Erythrobacter litoralis]|uniref:hypothetical protein n=1 Tax=Erythrobacter litoralis TaxID=39960 RepID=UPI002434ECE1|nr:hypothetical protein [Erythrobacter litoralis]MDG6078924.1 hypothetical protein [Erythrobacter litoralis]